MTITACSRDVESELSTACQRLQSDDLYAIPAYCIGQPEGAFWIWSPVSGRLERIRIPYRAEIAALLDVLRAFQPPWMSKRESRQEILAGYLLSPHAAAALSPTSLVWAPLTGVNTYKLDVEAGTCAPLFRNQMPAVWTYSSTPALNNARDYLFTARWHIENNCRADGGTQYSELIGCDLEDETEKVYARTPIGHSIHQVAAMPDGRRVLLNEFLTGLNGPVPEMASAEHRERLETLSHIGVKPSRLAVVDLQTGDCSTWSCPWPAPTHLVFDDEDPDVFYLVCHNIAVVATKMYLFGPGSLVRMRCLKMEFEVEAVYSHPSFHRLASHEHFVFHGRKAIAVTVYPNRCEIIDAEHFTRLALIGLYPIARLDGDDLRVPDLNAEYAFSACRAVADDLLVLSGSRRLYVIDTRVDPPLVEPILFNNDPKWVSRAHMVRLN